MICPLGQLRITKLRSYGTNKLVMAKQPDKVVVKKQRKMAAATSGRRDTRSLRNANLKAT